LGRGLASLIPNKKTSSTIDDANSELDIKDSRMEIDQVSPDDIQVNPHQPRKHFDDDELLNLVNSIKKHGILQPLVVVDLGNGKYQLVAGERRLRAARNLGFAEVPVIIRQAEDIEKLELSLIENIQRQDLNPLEEADAYKKLSDDFGLTQEEIAIRVGKRRSTIANIIRLLKLPAEAKEVLAEGKITLGHAKIILEATDEAMQLKLLRSIMDGNLSVKESRREVKKVQVKAHQRQISEKEARILDLEEKMREFFGQRVNITKKGSTGQVSIEFYSEEEMMDIIRKILE